MNNRKINNGYRSFGFSVDDDEEDIPIDVYEQLADVSRLLDIKTTVLDPFYYSCQNEAVFFDIEFQYHHSSLPFFAIVVLNYFANRKCGFLLEKEALDQHVIPLCSHCYI